MVDTQEEKIKKIFKSKGIKIEEVISIVAPNGRQTYYNKVRKEPLDMDFIEKIKSNFGIDLIYELSKLNSSILDSDEIKKLREDNRILNKRIDELSRQLHEAQQEIISLLRKK